MYLKKKLDESLKGVVEDCVNAVGVDLNTATPSLLSYISGINSSIAKNIVAYREEVGKFKNRKELLKVKRLGQKAFEQCAGFLRVMESKEPLDNTGVHPESYEGTKKFLSLLEYDVNDVKNNKLQDIDARVNNTGIDHICNKIDIGKPTLLDIIKEIKKTRKRSKRRFTKTYIKDRNC